MGNCLKGCCCYSCFLDSYLHIYVRDIKNFNVKSDINISGTNDLYVRITYQGIIQDTKVLNGEKSTAAFDEAIILENAVPSGGADKLLIEVYDRDTATSDDKLATAEIELPPDYGQNHGEKAHPLHREGKECGTITLDQVHFIKQKLIRYTGPCKCFCCCC